MNSRNLRIRYFQLFRVLPCLDFQAKRLLFKLKELFRFQIIGVLGYLFVNLRVLHRKRYERQRDGRNEQYRRPGIERGIFDRYSHAEQHNRREQKQNRIRIRPHPARDKLMKGTQSFIFRKIIPVKSLYHTVYFIISSKRFNVSSNSAIAASNDCGFVKSTPAIFNSSTGLSLPPEERNAL